MLDRYSILIVEDDDLLAMNLAAAVEDRECDVVGPAATVAAAMASLCGRAIDAAVLDASLPDRDVTPVAMQLIEKAIPFVIHTGIGLPAELAALFPQVSVILKPTDPDRVVAQLLRQLGAARSQDAGANPVPPADSVGDPARAKRIAKVAGALFDQFGAQAIVLARRQAEGAVGDVMATWSEIIADLQRRDLDQRGGTPLVA